jgi:AraC-like DNA-binding protein
MVLHVLFCTAITLTLHSPKGQTAAERLGFYDAFHFSKTFKRFWKKPPGSYRST